MIASPISGLSISKGCERTLGSGGTGLGRLAPFDGAERNRSFAYITGCLGAAAPATGLAIQASLLFVEGLGWSVHQAVDLIHRLTLLGITVRVPAHAKIGASAAMSPPIDTISWVFA